MNSIHPSQAIQIHQGTLLPGLGLGTWKIPGTETPQIVNQAIQLGYRHFDCACDYGNEAAVGTGLGQAFTSGLCRREDLWLTSKLWNNYHHPKHVRLACERSLKDLQVDYLDLYHVHFPIALEFVPFDLRYPPGWFHDPQAAKPAMKPTAIPIADTWGAMEALVQAGMVKHIGVCNFGTSLLRDLLSYARVRPSVLQIELHPFLTQEKLLRYCQLEQIAVTAFSPLGALSYFSLGMAKPEESVLAHPVVQAIATRLGRTPAQIVLRWGFQRGTAVIPKTSSPSRLKENLGVFEFELSTADMAAITGLNRNRRFNDPGDFCELAFNTFYPIYE